MNVCVVGKYPPVEGGVSSHNYWMARGLAERGHEVHVVTNGDEVEPWFRMSLRDGDTEWHQPRFAPHGAVTVWNPEPFGPRRMAHIPAANPFVTKLASVATQVVRHNECDVVFASYFEPYAVAGYLASRWTGRPLVVEHAGSDLERLMRVPDLGTTYVEVLKEADAILTGGPPLARRFVGMGLRAGRVHASPPFSVRTDVFHPGAAPLDVEDGIALAAPSLGASAPLRAEFDPRTPTIGIYGKLGVTKGSFDLVSALSILKREGLRFNFLAMTHGPQEDDFRAAVRDGGLEHDSWLLPFLPPWRVPGFLRACTAVCVLERAFPIAIHRPIVHREALACGTCLVLSDEIAGKEAYRDRLVHGDNVLLVEDPRDHDDLAKALRLAIERPEEAARIGRRGWALSKEIEDFGAFIDGFEDLFRDVVARRSSKVVDAPADAGEALSAAVRHVLPWAPALLGPELTHLIGRFVARGGVGAEDEVRLARRFCLFLADELDRLPPHHFEIVRSVVAHEEARLWAMVHEDAEVGAPLSPPDQLGGRPVASDGVVAELRPLRASHLRVEAFEFDVETFLQTDWAAAPAASRAASLPRRTTWVCFQRAPNLSGKEVRVNEATRDLLELCDGTRTAKEIAAVLTRPQTSGPEDDAAPRRVVAALQRCYDAGLIVFVRGPMAKALLVE